MNIESKHERRQDDLHHDEPERIVEHKRIRQEEALDEALNKHFPRV